MPAHRILAAAVLAIATAAHAQPAEPGRAGTAKIVSGAVRVAGTQGERPLQPGEPLAVADRIATGPDGTASMVLRDGTTLVMGSNSQLELQNFAYNSTTQQGNLALRLARGSMRMITGLIGKGRPDDVAIATPTATIGIRGTDFIVQVDDPADGQPR